MQPLVLNFLHISSLTLSTYVTIHTCGNTYLDILAFFKYKKFWRVDNNYLLRTCHQQKNQGTQATFYILSPVEEGDQVYMHKACDQMLVSINVVIVKGFAALIHHNLMMLNVPNFSRRRQRINFN